MIMHADYHRRMLSELRELACIDIRRPINPKGDAANYVNSLIDRVEAARTLMNHIVGAKYVCDAYKHWQDVFKPDAVAEGWDIRLMTGSFKEYGPIDTKTGVFTDTVIMNILDGRSDHHSAAREFLYSYSPCVYSIMSRRADSVRRLNWKKT